MCVPGVSRSQKRALYPLELELEMAESHHVEWYPDLLQEQQVL